MREIAVLKYPEVDVAVASFFLHFVWEFWQMPWYEGLPALNHMEGVIMCTRAAVGDVLIALVAFTGVSFTVKDRYWLRSPASMRVAGFLGIGLVFTVILEWLATSVFDRWQYVDAMWTIPVVGTGFAPVLQWLVVPVIVLISLRRLWRR